jgi:hypothetical protein
MAFEPNCRIYSGSVHPLEENFAFLTRRRKRCFLDRRLCWECLPVPVPLGAQPAAPS